MSTRVTEAELLQIEETAQYDEIHSAKNQERLAAEIRRYRALLIGLAAMGATVLGCPNHGQSGLRIPCPEGCPWPELEAEVQAIREKR